MNSPIEFYFDFSSPYAYFASLEIDELGRRYDRPVRWHPFLLGAVMKETGAKPLLKIPMKGEYAQHDLERIARLKKRPFTLPPVFPFAALAASRVFYWQEETDPELAHDLAIHLFRAGYQMGLDISDPEIVLDVAVALGCRRTEVAHALEDPAVKEKLHRAVASAVEERVFGSPFFLVDGEPFWGFDRMGMLEHWLKTEGW